MTITRVSSRRAALTGLALCLLLLSCEQTDLVAMKPHDGAACTDPECSNPPLCEARDCTQLAATSGFCLQTGELVSVGDSCADDDPTKQRFRFAVCSCTDFVTTSTVLIDGPGTTAIAIDRELRVGSGVTLQADVRVGETLRSGEANAPDVQGELIEHAAPSCACDPNTLLDVADVVAQHRDDNDNAQLGLDSRKLDGFDQPTDIDIECGRLYLSRIAGARALQLKVHGRVALFVAGNVELDDTLSIEVDDAARLTLLVAGNVRVGGTLDVSSAAGAANVRLVVGGAGTIDLGGQTRVVGALYAPRAELVTRGRFELTGAMFVRRAAPGAELALHYDAALMDVSVDDCAAP